jgi:hypothetical protein
MLMRKLAVTALSLSLSAAFAAGIPGNQKIYGTYVEARTADVVTGACFANAEEGLVGELGMMGWKVTKGSWDGVKLDGLSVVGVLKASDTLGNKYRTAYPVKSVLIVDERANTEQRLALQSFAKRMGGDLLQDVSRVMYQPVEIAFENDDLHSMKATLKAGEIAKIQTRAAGEDDHVCKNQEVWYQPLTKLDHAMPVFASAHTFRGEGLNTKWSAPGQVSSYVGTFVQDAQ